MIAGGPQGVQLPLHTISPSPSPQPYAYAFSPAWVWTAQSSMS